MRALISVQSNAPGVVLPPNTGDPSNNTPLPPALRMTDTMEDFFLATVTPRGSRPDMELPNSRMVDLASEVENLRRQLKDSDAEIRRIIVVQGNPDPSQAVPSHLDNGPAYFPHQLEFVLGLDERLVAIANVFSARLTRCWAPCGVGSLHRRSE